MGIGFLLSAASGLVQFFTKSRIGQILLLIALAGAGMVWLNNHAFERGVEAHKAQMAAAAAQAERERIDDDARLQGLSDFDLCRDYLRSRGMPIDACGHLRGVSGEQFEP